jgi:hypothetical protein
MKKFQFLLLDAGPIIELFELGIWEKILDVCDITTSQTIIEEAKYFSGENEDRQINLEYYKNRIHILDITSSQAESFLNQFIQEYQSDIHAGEKEILTFLNRVSSEWLLCSADSAVFRVLGLLGKSDQGISLEEILEKTGLTRKLEWRFTKKFREKFTQIGQIDLIQNKGLKNI